MPSKFLNSVALVMLALATVGMRSLFPVAEVSSTPAHGHSIVGWEPLHPTSGSAFVFVVHQPASLKSLKGDWQGHAVFFDWDRRRKAWVGLAGTAVDNPPGTYTLTVTGMSGVGKPVNFTQPVPVAGKQYPMIELSVPERYVAPDPETLVRVEKEREIKNKVFASAAPERQWSGSFIEPITSTASDGFGTQRKFNGVVKSIHQGLDFHAKMGTEVGAVNSGTVALARDLFYEGQCVMVDHGQGLMTIYMHLSEIKVHEGDKVTPGQVVGLSGASGRATGPHLHLGVRWQGIYLDPSSLFHLQLP